VPSGHKSQLSDNETQAILYNNGQYVNDNKSIRYREELLILLAHCADYWIAHVFEEGRPIYYVAGASQVGYNP
jgi:hypothetical protein